MDVCLCCTCINFYACLQITKVRRTLTEILLEVTTAEMKVLAREALEEYSGKSSPVK